MELRNYEYNTKYNENLLNETDSFENVGAIPANTKLQITLSTVDKPEKVRCYFMFSVENCLSSFLVHCIYLIYFHYRMTIYVFIYIYTHKFLYRNSRMLLSRNFFFFRLSPRVVPKLFSISRYFGRVISAFEVGRSSS